MIKQSLPEEVDVEDGDLEDPNEVGSRLVGSS